MDFCNGRQLYDIMTNYAHQLTDQVLLNIITQVFILNTQICDGVAEIHGLDFIHRDLKPENIVEHKDPS